MIFTVLLYCVRCHVYFVIIYFYAVSISAKRFSSSSQNYYATRKIREKSYQWWIKVLRVLKVGPAFCTRKTNYPIQISKATVLFNEVKIKSFDTELSNKSTYLMTKINSFTESVVWKKKSRKYCRTLRYKMKSSPVFYALK